jgi:hypothetical protein
MKPEATGRFFIAGCQRSGTTLLRLVLECHPQIFCFDELTAYSALARGEVAIPPGKRLAGFKIPRWTERLDDDVCRDEGHAETAPRFYRGEPILFLVRDVRDTVASMMRLQMTAEQNWLEFCARPILEAKVRDSEAFRHRWSRELGLLRRSGNCPAMLGALYWKYKTQAYFDYRRRGWPVLLVRYERLVRQPEHSLQRAIRCLGLDWDPRLLEHPQLPHPEVYPTGLAVGNTDPRRAIDTDSVGVWRQTLSREETARVLRMAGELNDRVRLGILGGAMRGGWRWMMEAVRG